MKCKRYWYNRYSAGFCFLAFFYLIYLVGFFWGPVQGPYDPYINIFGVASLSLLLVLYLREVICSAIEYDVDGFWYYSKSKARSLVHWSDIKNVADKRFQGQIEILSSSGQMHPVKYGISGYEGFISALQQRSSLGINSEDTSLEISDISRELGLCLPIIFVLCAAALSMLIDDITDARGYFILFISAGICAIPSYFRLRSVSIDDAGLKLHYKQRNVVYLFDYIENILHDTYEYKGSWVNELKIVFLSKDTKTVRVRGLGKYHTYLYFCLKRRLESR